MQRLSSTPALQAVVKQLLRKLVNHTVDVDVLAAVFDEMLVREGVTDEGWDRSWEWRRGGGESRWARHSVLKLIVYGYWSGGVLSL